MSHVVEVTNLNVIFIGYNKPDYRNDTTYVVTVVLFQWNKFESVCFALQLTAFKYRQL